MLITQTSGFSYTLSHVSLPQRNKRSKTVCTDVFNLLQIWNVGCTAENPAGLSCYITLYIIVQVAGSVCDLSLATSAASVSSILPNNSPTFKYLKIHLWVSYMFIVSSKFCFSSRLPKDNICHSILDYFFFQTSHRGSIDFFSLKFKLLLCTWLHRTEERICGVFL